MKSLNTLKYGNPSMFRTPVWVTLPSDPDVHIELTPLSYRHIQGIVESSYLTKLVEGYSQHDDIYSLLYIGVTSHIGTSGFPDIPSLINTLKISDRDYLLDELLKLSVITDEQCTEITKLVEITLDPRMSDETWSCESCKKIPGMQQTRACPLIDGNKDRFSIRIGETSYTECPVGLTDNFITNQAFSAYKFYDAGNLPLSGGIGDQHMWVIIATKIIAPLINKKAPEE